MQNADNSLETVLSPLELAVCLLVDELPGVTSEDVREYLKAGKYDYIGVTTGHYSRISAAMRRLADAGKIARRKPERTEDRRMGRLPFIYYITPQGEAAIVNTMAYRKQIQPEA
jgi:predicted transcriptional regulator